jgi:TonB family protein
MWVSNPDCSARSHPENCPRIVSDCRMADDPAMMSYVIAANVYKSKRQRFVATALSSLILCTFCPPSLQGIRAAANKTDAEFAKAVIGTWQVLPTEGGFSKQFVTFNADGTSKVIVIFNSRGSPRHSEGEGTWRVNHGYLIMEAIKTTHRFPIRFNLHAQIESIENGIVKLRDEKGEKGELHRIGQLPSLPPLFMPTIFTPEQVQKLAIYKPQPEYPLRARAQHLTGNGFFILHVEIRTGLVKDVQVERSTGSSILDAAAINGLKQWRFKPGALSPPRLAVDLPERSVIRPEDYLVRVPVHFAMRKKP